jgi:hypothetical protein
MDELTVDAEHSASTGTWASAAVVIGVDCFSDCNALYSGKHKKGTAPRVRCARGDD